MAELITIESKRTAWGVCTNGATSVIENAFSRSELMWLLEVDTFAIDGTISSGTACHAAEPRITDRWIRTSKFERYDWNGVPAIHRSL